MSVHVHLHMRVHKEVEMKAVHKFSSLVTVAFVQLLFNRGIRIFSKALSFPKNLVISLKVCCFK